MNGISFAGKGLPDVDWKPPTAVFGNNCRAVVFGTVINHLRYHRSLDVTTDDCCCCCCDGFERTPSWIDRCLLGSRVGLRSYDRLLSLDGNYISIEHSDTIFAVHDFKEVMKPPITACIQSHCTADLFVLRDLINRMHDKQSSNQAQTYLNDERVLSSVRDYVLLVWNFLSQNWFHYT